MTQPDRWDDMAEALELKLRWNSMYDRDEIAAALRSAYSEGEKAGMEKAVRLADSLARRYEAEARMSVTIPDEMNATGGPSAFYELADLIRAVKETKE